MAAEGFIDGRGKYQIVPMSDWRKQRYLQWLCTAPADRDPKTKGLLAEELGLDRRSLNRWEDDPEFMREWEKTYLKTIGNPGRKQQIMDTLFKTATDGDDPKHVAAAKEYFAIEGSLRPQKVQVNVSRDPNDLTDEAIEGLIAAHAQSMKENREPAGTPET
jgi:hypothetical protein